MQFLRLVCVLLALLLLVVPAMAQDVPTAESADCPFAVPDGQTVECGYLTVPQDRDDAANTATVTIPYAVFRSPNPDKLPDPIIYLEGGPGGDALETVPLIFNFRFAPLLANRDLIMFDQRGTGYSEPSLSCPEVIQYSLDTLDDLLTPQEVAEGSVAALLECRDRLLSEGVNLTAYSSADSAADMEDLRNALGIEQWNVYGLSYGTRLALTYMRDFPEAIRSVVLDSAYPPQVDLYTSIPVNAERALQTLFAGCAADEACNAVYPDLEGSLTELVEKLNAEPTMIRLTNPLAGETYDGLLTGDAIMSFVFSSLYDSTIFPAIPQMIHAGLDDNFDSLSILFGAFLANADFSSIGMQLSVQCQEDVAFLSEEALLTAADDFPRWQNFFIAAANLGEPVFGLCQAWGAGEADPIENEAVISSLPTLILAGEYDPITPPSWGVLTGETLENSFYFEYPGVGHGAAFSDTCPMNMLLAFVDDPAAEPDSACIADMTAPVFPLYARPGSGDEATITLVSFTNDTFGITGLVPDGWSEVAPGVYSRGESALDTAVVIQQAAPGMTGDALFDVLLGQLQITDKPEPSDTRTANGLDWTLYKLEVQGVVVWGAVTQDDAKAYLILLQANPSEIEPLYERIFLPIVDALVSTE